MVLKGSPSKSLGRTVCSSEGGWRGGGGGEGGQGPSISLVVVSVSDCADLLRTPMLERREEGRSSLLRRRVGEADLPGASNSTDVVKGIG